jgi:hypothetical protein
MQNATQPSSLKCNCVCTDEIIGCHQCGLGKKQVTKNGKLMNIIGIARRNINRMTKSKRMRLAWHVARRERGEMHTKC